MGDDDQDNDEQNINWIAAAHNAMPALLATLDEKDAQLALVNLDLDAESARVSLRDKRIESLRAELQQANAALDVP